MRAMTRSLPRLGLAFSLVASLGLGLSLPACSRGGAVDRKPVPPDLSDHYFPDEDEDMASPTPADLSTPTDMASGPQPDWDKLSAYLDSLYDSNQSLLRAHPMTGDIWTASDNMAAARAYEYLPKPNLMRRDAILSALKSYKICGCDVRSEHDATINHHHDPLVLKGAQIPTTPQRDCTRTPRKVSGPTSSCDSGGSRCPSAAIVHEDHAPWVGDPCNFGICNGGAISGWDESGPGRGLAQTMALQILNRKNRGMPTNELWQNLALKWDGRGLYDARADQDRRYSVQALALFKIVARVLEKPLPSGVDEKLIAAQGPNGGIRTAYALDGSFTLDQQGTAETTSYVVLAFRKPVTDF
jgi:hypothetical protein